MARSLDEILALHNWGITVELAKQIKRAEEAEEKLKNIQKPPTKIEPPPKQKAKAKEPPSVA